MKKLMVGMAVVLSLAACTSATTAGITQSPTVHAASSTGSQAAPSSPAVSSVVSTTEEPAVTPTAPSSTSSSTDQRGSTLEACAHYTNHVYEVCTAYIANSSLAVLVPYYKYAKSDNSTLARYVTYRLGSRYTGQAYSTITSRAASWPKGTHKVRVPTIRIVSVRASLATNTATLVTRETWKVTAKSGQVIYQESNQRHSVTMRRVPSYVLHKWVVTSLY